MIRYLLAEQPRFKDMELPAEEAEQRRLLRSLYNIRLPAAISEEFLRVQDEYLQVETCRKGITELSALKPVE